MERKKLTAESLEKAETYIPLARKYAIVQLLAPGCIERTESGFWRQNVIGRNLVGCYILAGFYLHLIDTSGLDKTDEEGNPKPEFQFTLEDYDRMAGTERDIWTVNGQIAQEITDDFRDMKDILDREIAASLAEKNDPFNRFQEALRMGLTPDVVQEFQKAVEAASSAAAGERGGTEAAPYTRRAGALSPAGNGGDEG